MAQEYPADRIQLGAVAPRQDEARLYLLDAWRENHLAGHYQAGAFEKAADPVGGEAR